MYNEQVIGAGPRKANGRYGRQEVERLLEDYRASGMSQKHWCARSGVKLATLGYWLRREQERQEGYALVAVEPLRRSGAGGEVKVSIRGVELSLPGDPAGVDLLVRLIRELGQ